MYNSYSYRTVPTSVTEVNDKLYWLSLDEYDRQYWVARRVWPSFKMFIWKTAEVFSVKVALEDMLQTLIKPKGQVKFFPYIISVSCSAFGCQIAVIKETSASFIQLQSSRSPLLVKLKTHRLSSPPATSLFKELAITVQTTLQLPKKYDFKQSSSFIICPEVTVKLHTNKQLLQVPMKSKSPEALKAKEEILCIGMEEFPSFTWYSGVRLFLCRINKIFVRLVMKVLQMSQFQSGEQVMQLGWQLVEQLVWRVQLDGRDVVECVDSFGDIQGLRLSESEFTAIAKDSRSTKTSISFIVQDGFYQITSKILSFNKQLFKQRQNTNHMFHIYFQSMNQAQKRLSISTQTSFMQIRLLAKL